MTVDLDHAIDILAPIILDVVKTLQERNSGEPTLEQVKAELSSDKGRARAEAVAFYQRHPDLRPSQS